MPLTLFELLSVVVIAATLAAMARRRGSTGGWQVLLQDYAALALAGWIGEESCILLYRHYAYADGWHLRLHEVPLLVPLIWPLVILSAREVCSGLFPSATQRWRPLIVGAIVVIDASMVEVLAVRAGMWRWAEPGHLGVPLIGILGWGFFAAAAELVLGSDRKERRALVIVAAPALTHLALVLVWWGGLRWIARGSLEPASLVAVAALSVLATALVIARRRAGHAIERAVAGPRVFAAALFFALLVSTAARDLPLWAHVVAVAVPYWAGTRLWGAPRALAR
jgi:hypothetical protein